MIFLQFADDTIILRDANPVNLWCIKAVLRGFEWVSGLCINFNKSKIYCINITMEEAATVFNFLPCDVGTIPFSFLGVLVGANHRRKDMWKLLISKLSSRLSYWQGKHLFMGGKFTLLNSVLNNILFFWLSFFKAPKVV